MLLAVQPHMQPLHKYYLTIPSYPKLSPPSPAIPSHPQLRPWDGPNFSVGNVLITIPGPYLFFYGALRGPEK